MDSFHHHQQQQQHDRRVLGQPMAAGGVGGGEHPWYPSSSPPPPPPPGSYYNPSYHHPPPPQPQPHYQQHQHHPMGMGPPPPPLPPPHPQALPPYHGQPPPVPPPAAPYPHHSQYPPPLPPWPHHPMPMPHQPPPQPAYPPPPGQAWGNPSWAQHQGWDYPERNIPYNNEDDWAARAKAWATAKSGMENHHTQSHFSSIGTVDEQSYAYHDQYQHTVGPFRDLHQPPFPQSSNQLPASTTDPWKQVNLLHGSTSFSSGSSSYGTGYNVGGETTNRSADHIASPQKSYGPSSSIHEQEVSYSYSSSPGNREAVHQHEGSHIPVSLPGLAVQDGHHLQSTLPAQTISTEPHFSSHRQPTNFLPDVCDRPLEFEPRHDSGRESHQKINYGLAGPAGAVGMMDNDPAASSVHTWTQSTTTGVGFPQIPLGPSGTQLDPTFIPQASLSMQPSPVFGGIPAPNFQPNVPPVSAPYGLGPGASFNAAAFSGDLNGAGNLSERPKKAAVPNWLREEIIKKKSSISSAVSSRPTGNSFDSIGSEDGERSLRRADQSDSKSIDSTRSTEDEDDEEDVEAAKSAAINQQIKRVLTEVLLKVTNELFEEIATKVLNEDEPTVGGEGNAVNGNQRVSPPTAIRTPKASARVLVPLKMETNKVDSVGEISGANSPGGNILGLANYASDDDDDDEMRSSKLLPSEKREIASHQWESNAMPSENDVKSIIDEEGVDGVAQKYVARLREENNMTENGSSAIDNSHESDKASEGISAVCEESIPADSKKVKEPPSETAISLQSTDVVGAKDDKGKEFASGHSRSDKVLTKDYPVRESRREMDNIKNSQSRGDAKVGMEKTGRDSSDTSDSIIHKDGNKIKVKVDKRDKLKEQTDDRGSERGSIGKESNSRRSSKHNGIKDDRKETTKDKREKHKDDGERKRERARDEKDDQSTRTTKDSYRYNSRRSPSPSSRGKSIKSNSFTHGSASGDEPSDNSKKRKKLSRNGSLSPSPTKSRKRQDSRSPHSKHSHRRHSPYSSTERRRRSRSSSPGHRRSSAHKRGS